MQRKGFVKRERHSTSGAGALVVVVNSAGAYWDHCIVDETVLVALEHFGMPYRVLDLAVERPTAESLNNCACIVLAQNRLGSALSESETQVICDAVKAGAGLVNFDNDLRLYASPLLEIFGFERINPYPYATNIMRILESGHAIAAMQTPGECHDFDRMVSAVIVEKWRDDVAPLADGILGKEQLIYTRHLAPWSAFEPRNHACLFAARWGKGKAVQFTLNPRVWRSGFYGHARGMDDLFWRSTVWAARKPFVANMIPPFVALSVDDCSGRHDFAYADVAAEHGYVPLLALFINWVPERLHPKIKEGLISGRIAFTSHALDYYHLLVYNFGRGECTPDELRKNFAADDAFWKKVGAAPGATNRLHWGEYGVAALPFLKERGRIFFNPALQHGLPKMDAFLDKGFWPYSLQTCYYDYLPDDDDFFAFGTTFTRGNEDFLSGCTVYLRESDKSDVEKAATSAADRIQKGLRAAFFGELITHEQKVGGLSIEEWGRVLTRTDELTRHVEKMHASHDDIGRYLKGKDGVHIAQAIVEGDQARCVLRGKTTVPLRLSIFRDEGDDIVREYKAVTSFEGESQIA